MFYESAEIDQELRCSYCKQNFAGVVKVVPCCGESICDECYEDLKSSLTNAGAFKCRACQLDHTMPPTGLPDAKSIGRLLKKRRIEKPMSEEAKRLRSELKNVKDSLDELKAFNQQEHINVYCDQLESDVVESFASLIEHFKEIEKDMLKEIDDYRRQCLETWGAGSNQRSKKAGTQSETRQLLDDLDRSIKSFSSKWDAYFERPDTVASDSDVCSALNNAGALNQTLGSLKAAMKNQVFQDRLMVIKPSFFDDQFRLRELFDLKIQYQSPCGNVIQEMSTRTLRGHKKMIFQLAFCADGRLVSCSSDATIKVWNIRNGAQLFELTGHVNWVYSLAMLPNGLLASGSEDQTIKIWDLDLRKDVRTLKGHAKGVLSLQVFKKGNLASYSLDGTIKIWNPNRNSDNLLMTIRGHENTKWIVPFGILSNDFLVTCTADSENASRSVMKVWSPRDGQMAKSVPIEVANFRTILGLANGQVALGFENGTIKLIDWTNDTSYTKTNAHLAFVSSLAQLPDGKLLSAGNDESRWMVRSVKLWDLPDFKLLQTIPTDHSGVIDSIALSPDGLFFATGARDQLVKLWPLPSKII